MLQPGLVGSPSTSTTALPGHEENQSGEEIYALSNRNVIGNHSVQIEEPTVRGMGAAGRE